MRALNETGAETVLRRFESCTRSWHRRTDHQVACSSRPTTFEWKGLAKGGKDGRRGPKKELREEDILRGLVNFSHCVSESLTYNLDGWFVNRL
jgi:hypothetical protein